MLSTAVSGVSLAGSKVCQRLQAVQPRRRGVHGRLAARRVVVSDSAAPI